MTEEELSGWRRMLSEDMVTACALWVSGTDVHHSSRRFLVPDRGYERDLAFHGSWHPEVPYQMVRRYTVPGDSVWSVFAGTGVDGDVCASLGRECVMTDLVPRRPEVIGCDVREADLGRRFRLVLCHPPYWNIVRYSEDGRCGSNAPTLSAFLDWFGEVAKSVDAHLDEDGYCVLCCGSVFENGEEVELGELMKWRMLSMGYRLKARIVKDYGEARSYGDTYNLDYYRHLKNGTYSFYGESVYVLQKKRSKNALVRAMRRMTVG